MKSTKLFLYSSVAAVALAACNDDLELAEKVQTAQDLSVRPVVEGVTLSLGEKTRFSVEDGSYGPTFEDGDRVGAVLLDVANYRSKKEYNDIIASATPATSQAAWKNLYEIDEWSRIWSNYQFKAGVDKNGDPAMVSEAKLIEGNYMFYAPFSDSHLTRETFRAVVPIVQKGDGGATFTGKYQSKDRLIQTEATKEFFESGEVVEVGYQRIYKENEDSKVKTTINDIFSYPMFTIENNFEGTLFAYDTPASQKGTSYNGKDGATKGIDMLVTKVQIFVLPLESDPQGPTNGNNQDEQHPSAKVNPASTTIWESCPIKTDWLVSRLELADEDDITSSAWVKDVRQDAPTSQILWDFATVHSQDPETARTAEEWYEANEYELLGSKLGGDNAKSNYNAYTIELNMEIKSGESKSFMAVLPAENYGMRLVAKVYAKAKPAGAASYNQYKDLTTDEMVDYTYVFHVAQNAGMPYVAPTTTTPAKGYGAPEYVVAKQTYTDLFEDPKHDFSKAGVTLVRGNRFPAAELQTTFVKGQPSTKSWAGELLTIRFDSAAGYPIDTTRVLTPIVEPNPWGGFHHNAEITGWARDYVNRFNLLIQDQTILEGTPDPKTGKVPSAVGNRFAMCYDAKNDCAIGEENDVVINTELLKALHEQLYSENIKKQLGFLVFTEPTHPVKVDETENIEWTVDLSVTENETVKKYGYGELGQYVSPASFDMLPSEVVETLYFVNFEVKNDKGEVVVKNTIIMPINVINSANGWTTLTQGYNFVENGTHTLMTSEDAVTAGMPIYVNVSAAANATIRPFVSGLAYKFQNEGTLTLQNDSKAEIVNNGTLNLTLANSATASKVEGVITNNGVMNVSAGVTVKNNANTNAEGATINVEDNANVKVGQNDGTINIGGNGAYVIALAGEGVIENTVQAQVEVNDAQTVVASTTDVTAFTAIEDAHINALMLTGTQNLTDFDNLAVEGIKEMTIDGTLNVTVKKLSQTVSMPLTLAPGAALNIKANTTLNDYEVTFANLTAEDTQVTADSNVTIK